MAGQKQPGTVKGMVSTSSSNLGGFFAASEERQALWARWQKPWEQEC